MSTTSREKTASQFKDSFNEVDADVIDFERMEYTGLFEDAVSKSVHDHIENGVSVVDLERSDWSSRILGQIEYNLDEIEKYYGSRASELRDIADYTIASQVIESFKQNPTDKKLKKALYHLPLSTEIIEQLIVETYEEYRELHDAMNRQEKKFHGSKNIQTAIDAVGETFAGIAAGVDDEAVPITKLSILIGGRQKHKSKRTLHRTPSADVHNDLARFINVVDGEASEARPLDLDEFCKNNQHLADTLRKIGNTRTGKAAVATALTGALGVATPLAAAADSQKSPPPADFSEQASAIHTKALTVAEWGTIQPISLDNVSKQQLPAAQLDLQAVALDSGIKQSKIVLSDVSMDAVALEDTPAISKSIRDDLRQLTATPLEELSGEKTTPRELTSAERQQRLMSQAGGDVVVSVAGSTGATTREANPDSTVSDNERKQQAEAMRLLVRDVENRNNVRMVVDPTFAVGAGSQNQMLLGAINTALANPAMLNELISKEQRQLLLDRDFYGNPDLVLANVEEIFDQNEYSREYLAWIENFPGTDEDKQLIMSMVATADSSLMSGDEVLAIMEKNGVTLTQGQIEMSDKIVNTVLPKYPDSGSNEKAAAIEKEARYEGFVKGVKELNDRPTNIYSGWESDIEDLGKLIWETTGSYDPDWLTPELVAAQLFQESQFTPVVGSHMGAQGIAQFMPATWKEWGRDLNGDGVADFNNPAEAIDALCRYMIYLHDNYTGKFEGDLRIWVTLGGYNAGPGRVQQYGSKLIDGSLKGYFSMEPTDYVNAIQDHLSVIEGHESNTIAAAKDEIEAVRNDDAAEKEWEAKKQKLIDQGFTVESVSGSGRWEMVPEMYRDSPYIHQGALKYNGVKFDGKDMRVWGCGPSTLAMVWARAGGESTADPLSTFEEVVDSGYMTGDGMSHSAIVELSREHGYDAIPLRDITMEEIRLAFANGATSVTMNIDPNKAKGHDDVYHGGRGHIFSIDGITEDGKLVVRDSALFEDTQQAWDPDTILPYTSPTAVVAIADKGDLKSYEKLIEKDEKGDKEKEDTPRVDPITPGKPGDQPEDKPRTLPVEPPADVPEPPVAELPAQPEKPEEEDKPKESEKPKDEPKDNGKSKDKGADKPKDKGKETSRENLSKGTDLVRSVMGSNTKTGLLTKDQLARVDGMREAMGKNRDPVMLQPEAATQFEKLNDAFEARFGHKLVVNDSYRNLEAQISIAGNSLSASAGRSIHGVGLAVDVNLPGGRYSDESKWLYENGPEYGFVNPNRYNPNSSAFNGKDEHWHYEYYGSMAKDEVDALFRALP